MALASAFRPGVIDAAATLGTIASLGGAGSAASLHWLVQGIMVGAFVALACGACISFIASRSAPFAWLGLTALSTAGFHFAITQEGSPDPIILSSAWEEVALPLAGSGMALFFSAFVCSLARRDAISVPALPEAARATMALVALNLWAHWLPPEMGSLMLLVAMLACVCFAVLFLRVRDVATMAGLLSATALAALITLAQRLDAIEGYLRALDGAWPLDASVLTAIVTALADLTVLTLWLAHVGNPRQRARTVLAKWQAKEHLRLSREVARQTAALNQALAYAEQKNRQKIQTLGYVGHDLRAPLATILGYVRLLRASQRRPKAEHLDAIERSVAYQLTLIDDVLDYAKAELQPLHLDPTPTSLADLLKEVAAYAAMLGRANHNRFVYAPPPFLPAQVEVDGHRLQQVLLNLLANATKFTLRGTIRLTLAATRAKQGGHWRLRFAVQDEGIGIAQEAQNSIFDAFTQLERTNGGVGLGLFIAERIVEGMGGKLALSSVLGEGSTFSFEVDVAERDGTLVAVDPYLSDETEPDPPAVAAGAWATPPSPARLELALLARDGRLTDIEEWLQRITQVHPGFEPYYEEVRKAVLTLDLARLETLALHSPEG